MSKLRIWLWIEKDDADRNYFMLQKWKYFLHLFLLIDRDWANQIHKCIISPKKQRRRVITLLPQNNNSYGFCYAFLQYLWFIFANFYYRISHLQFPSSSCIYPQYHISNFTQVTTPLNWILSLNIGFRNSICIVS